MHNLVEKFTPAVEATDDEGVVAIEYVLIAGFVAVGVAVAFAIRAVDKNGHHAQRTHPLGHLVSGRSSANCSAP